MFVVAFVVALAVDVVTKSLVVHFLAPGRAVPAGWWAPVRLRHVRNPRVVGGRRVVAICWLLTVAGGLLLALTLFDGMTAARLGLGLAAGGATGNAVDQISGRAVVDFVDLGWWPVFNVADVAITGGVALTLWSVV